MAERTPPRPRVTGRRRVLALAAASAGSFGALSGCLGSSETREGETDWNATVALTPDSENDSASVDAKKSGDEPTFEPDADRQRHEERYTVDYDHPVTQELGRKPTLCDHPDEIGALVVEFDDISCRVCAEFHRETFPSLVANLIESGEATYAVRNFPRTHDWATPATYALESVYARDPARFWELRGHLYERRSDLNEETVLERVESFLADTDLDGAAVLEDVEREQYAATIERNLEIRQETGVFNTPRSSSSRTASFGPD